MVKAVKNVSLALTSLFSPFGEFAKLIRAFCREHRFVVIFSIVLFFICFGFEITNPTLSIDEEGALLGGSGFASWLSQGRLGIAVFKSIFQTHTLLPLFLSSFISAALWTFSGIAWCAVLFFREGSATRLSSLPLAIFCGFFVSMPTVVAEFMVFGTYNIEVSLAMVFSAVSVYCVTRYSGAGLLRFARNDGEREASDKKSRKYFFAALFPLAFAISIYQSFVAVFITGAIAALVCDLMHSQACRFERDEESFCDDSKGNRTFTKWLRMIPPYIFVLLISLAIYYALLYIALAITGVQASAYVDAFSGWESGEPFAAIFRNTLVQIYLHFFSSGFPGAIGVLFTAIALGIATLLCIFSFKGWRRAIIPALCVFLGLSPFALNLAFMGFMPLRAMQALPLMMGVAWFVLYTVIKRLTSSRMAVIIPCIVALMLIFGQVQTINKLFYGGHLQYQMDRQIAAMVMHDVKREFGGIPDTPIMFLGVHHSSPNPVIVPTGIIGRSFWDFDDMDNSRITGFLRAIGYDIVSSDLDKREMEGRYRYLMPVWPEQGSIIETPDGIMIRLS